MTARHWMRIAALASALGLAGTAVAQNTHGTTRSDDGSVPSYGMDAPSSGAIVTPEDRALGMGQDNARAGDRNGDADERGTTSNDDTLSVNPGTSRDDRLTINPGRSNDEDLSVNPGRSNDEDLSVNPGRSNDENSSINPGRSDDQDTNVNPGRSRLDDASPGYRARGMINDRDDATQNDEASAPRTGGDMQPRSMGPGSRRGE